MTEPLAPDADLVGELSPPRSNGELVFAAPWERRVFGLTLALCRAHTFEWERFRARLIAQIAADQRRPYWQSWAAALEDLLAETSLLARSELDGLQDELNRWPEGHDHRH
jgi:nitrile hydratase accessory protein